MTAGAADSPLDPATRALVELAAAQGAGDLTAVEAALDRAADAVEPLAVEEALLQSYLFLGYPAALNALAAWRRRVGPPARATAEARAPATAEPPATAESPKPRGTPDWESWRRRGEAVCARVYGGQYDRLRENIAALHPEMERWMLAEGYGKVLGRAGLDLETRELCIAALLAAAGAERQLYSHLRGALNVGAPAERVEAALDAACRFMASHRAARARAVWADVRARHGDGGGSAAPGEVRGEPSR